MNGRIEPVPERTVETRASDREANMWIFTRAALELLRDALGRA